MNNIYGDDYQVLLDWIGLNFFNDDTCPSGHISRSTHVNVSKSCFYSLNKLPKPDDMVLVLSKG